MRLVARYGDACNLSPSPEIPKKLQILQQHCIEAERGYGGIEKTSVIGFDLDPAGSKTAEFIGKLRWLASMGIETVIGSVPQKDTLATIEHLGREMIPADRDIYNQQSSCYVLR